MLIAISLLVYTLTADLLVSAVGCCSVIPIVNNLFFGQNAAMKVCA